MLDALKRGEDVPGWSDADDAVLAGMEAKELPPLPEGLIEEE